MVRSSQTMPGMTIPCRAGDCPSLCAGASAETCRVTKKHVGSMGVDVEKCWKLKKYCDEQNWMNLTGL